MNEIHYDEETLLTFLEDPIALDCGDDLELHMLECAPCGRLFESVREFYAALSDAAVWGEDEPSLLEAEPDPEKLEEFLAFARTLSSEEGEAERLVPALLRMPPEQWPAEIDASPRLRTAAALRRISEEARRMLNIEPARALELAVLASDFAESLTVDSYTGDTVFQLRGVCWKERANALRYLGRLKEAIKALDRADMAFSQTSVCHFDLATVAYVRGTLLVEMERTAEALELARTSADTFLTFGDLRRYSHSKMLEGAIYFGRHDYAQARDVWIALLKPLRANNDLNSLANLFNNIGQCFVKLGDSDSAGTYFLQAMLLYQDLGMETEKVRSRWGLARLLVSTGKFAEGIVRLKQTRSDFNSLSMRGDAALVSLDMVEAMLASGQNEEVPVICRELADQFAMEGMNSTAGMALAYLREAVAAEEANPEVIGHVRAYLEELPAQPGREFVPLPS
ncbi:MAG TPA: hypothetical protein VMS12_10595 [Thermoanaerobaculia bacterium]|nr:hypothetical protein [Thermoanaerobaculia bacterium]